MAKNSLILLVLIFISCSSGKLRISEHSRGFAPELVKESGIYVAPVLISNSDFSTEKADSIFAETWRYWLPYIHYEKFEQKIEKPDKKLFKKLLAQESCRYFLITKLKEQREDDPVFCELDTKIWDMSINRLIWHSVYTDNCKDSEKFLREGIAKTLKSTPVYLNLGRPME